MTTPNRPSTRVWRQLAATQPQPAMPRTDAVLRLALASMAADAQSGLDADARQAVWALLGDHGALPAEARQWRPVLLAWARRRVPGGVARLEGAWEDMDTKTV
jgi:hypothetical protein